MDFTVMGMDSPRHIYKIANRALPVEHIVVHFYASVVGFI
jgi:hypothetical protein